MIYTELTVLSMKIAYDAHHGQLDKNGVPYIFHPYHLAEQMHDEYSVCAALLHDVVEDTNVTIEELEAIFPEAVTNAVRLLTHDESDDYFEYILRIKKDPVARAVKLADLRHNSNKDRITDKSRLTPQLSEKIEQKYLKAISLLESDSIKP